MGSSACMFGTWETESGRKGVFWSAGREPKGWEGAVDHLDYHTGQDPLYPEPLNRDEIRIT